MTRGGYPTLTHLWHGKMQPWLTGLPYVCTADWANPLIMLRWFTHNIGAIMAKIKLPKNPLNMVIFLTKARRSYPDLSSQADPARDNWTWSYTYFSENAHFALVENTITHAWSILIRFDIKFLENAWGFHCGVTWRNELQWEVLNRIQKVNVLWVEF